MFSGVRGVTFEQDEFVTTVFHFKDWILELLDVLVLIFEGFFSDFELFLDLLVAIFIFLRVFGNVSFPEIVKCLSGFDFLLTYNSLTFNDENLPDSVADATIFDFSI